MRLEGNLEDDEIWLQEERAKRRRAEREVRAHARELAAARREVEEARRAQDELLCNMHGRDVFGDDVESAGSLNSGT